MLQSNTKLIFLLARNSGAQASRRNTLAACLKMFAVPGWVRFDPFTTSKYHSGYFSSGMNSVKSYLRSMPYGAYCFCSWRRNSANPPGARRDRLDNAGCAERLRRGQLPLCMRARPRLALTVDEKNHAVSDARARSLCPRRSSLSGRPRRRNGSAGFVTAAGSGGSTRK